MNKTILGLTLPLVFFAAVAFILCLFVPKDLAPVFLAAGLAILALFAVLVWVRAATVIRRSRKR
jgi:hypothetical protein